MAHDSLLQFFEEKYKYRHRNIYFYGQMRKMIKMVKKSKKALDKHIFL